MKKNIHHFFKDSILRKCFFLSIIWHLVFSSVLILGPRTHDFLQKSSIPSVKKPAHRLDKTDTITLDFSNSHNTIDTISIIPFTMPKSVQVDDTVNALSLPTWDDIVDTASINREIPPKRTPLKNIEQIIYNRFSTIGMNKETTLTNY